MSYSDKATVSAVAALIQDSAGRILLCQQSGGHHLWGLPGGRIRAAESPVHAAIRDIREETGTETEILDVVGIYEVTGDGCGEATPDLVVYVFRGRVGGEVMLNAPGRIGRLCWHSAEALPEPLTATTRAALTDAASGLSGVLRRLERDHEPAAADVAEAEPVPVTV
jgi:ADP-ribose pyrophosphatase YjhB (NUDIX family)